MPKYRNIYGSLMKSVSFFQKSALNIGGKVKSDKIGMSRKESRQQAKVAPLVG